MAFLSGLFDKLKAHSASKCETKQRKGQLPCKTGDRLIIFKYNDIKGCSVLFDSSVPVDSSQQKEPTSCRKKLASDIPQLRDMMFGSSPMPQQSSTLKVHMTRSPPKLMVTKIFLPTPTSNESSGEHESFDLYSVRILEANESSMPISVTDNHVDKIGLASSVPVDVPIHMNRLTSSGNWDDSGFSTSGSSPSSTAFVSPSPTNSLTSSLNSYNSRHRRYHRHQVTQIEHSLSNSLPHDYSEALPLHKRPTKIGIGIVFALSTDNVDANTRFQNFFFSHIMLVESYVHKLKLAVDEALAARSRAIICKAMDTFFNSVYSLYSAPRIPEPIWLSMMTCSSQRSQLCTKFLNDFVSLTKKCDTKSSKFFLSCLITGVLTHHLSWASTVAPVGDTPASTYLDKHMAKWLNTLARSHSYNPLWAQLGDLYGAVGFPRCLTRTVIIGKDVMLIEQILRVLTYFIRCSELAENTEVCPLLTADVDDTTTLMSVSDIATPVGCDSATPVGCLAADVTLLSSDSVSTSVKSVSPVAVVRQQLMTAIESDGSPAVVLKPAPNSNERGIRVRFENGESKSTCSIDASKSPNESFQNTFIADCAASNLDEATTPVPTELSVPHITDSQLVPRPVLCFRSDITDTLPPLLAVTCSGCNCTDPCKDCSENFKNLHLRDLSQRNDDITLVTSCKSLNCTTSDAPSDTGARTLVAKDGGKNLPSSSSPKPCQLSPMEANENVYVERVAHLRREAVKEPEQKVFRVPLEKPVVTSPDSCHSSRKSLVLPPKEHFLRVPQYQRSNSMFDEYFDGSSSCPVFDLCIGADGRSAFTHDVDDIGMFDEIMNDEPCPDVSHIDVSQSSSGSSSSEMVPDPLLDNTMSSGLLEVVPDSTEVSKAPSKSSSTMLLDNVFDERHFNSDEHLNDIPDGPSKQMISSAIKLMQDVCSDRTSQASVDDLADIPASDYFSQTGLGPSRGRQRHPSAQSNASARCRSATPSDSATCRQTSTSSCDAHPLCAYDCLVELPVPKGRESLEEGTLSPESNLGRSLLAGYCDRYQPDFVLHGTSDRSFLDKQLHADLRLTLKNSVLDEPIAETSCIVADLDDWSVKLYSCTYNDAERLKKQPLMSSSKLVCRLVESVHEFWSMKVSPEFCLMHLEDQLQSIYLNSKLLAEYIKVHRRIFSHELASLHEFDASDISLLLAVAGTHSPGLLLSLTENQLMKCETAH